MGTLLISRNQMQRAGKEEPLTIIQAGDSSGEGALGQRAGQELAAKTGSSIWGCNSRSTTRSSGQDPRAQHSLSETSGQQQFGAPEQKDPNNQGEFGPAVPRAGAWPCEQRLGLVQPGQRQLWGHLTHTPGPWGGRGEEAAEPSAAGAAMRGPQVGTGTFSMRTGRPCTGRLGRLHPWGL